MLRLAIAAVLGILLIGSAALAEDLWAEDPIIGDNPNSEEVEADQATPEIPEGMATPFDPAILDEDNPSHRILGGYFGSGDEFIYPGEYIGSSELTPSGMIEYDGKTYYYGHPGDYSSENVYGPMWGVPSEAVGLDEYDPFQYYIISGGDPNNLPPEIRDEVLSRLKVVEAEQASGDQAGESEYQTWFEPGEWDF